MKIKIHQKPKKIKLLNRSLIDLMERVCSDLDLDTNGILSFIFYDNPSISALHKEYFDDDSPTDVITFNLSEDHFEGEVYIGWQIAEQQAKEYGVTYDEEILRLMIHGILHLNGMKDNNNTGRAQMRKEENRLLSFFK